MTPRDAPAWLAMRCELWPDSPREEHEREIASFFSGKALEPAAVLLATVPGSGPAGFIELSVRACAEGCETTGVAYVEGWFVGEEARGRGVGRALIEAGEDWGRAMGCRELASDTALDNAASAAAHLAVGFEETGRIRCFRKRI